jgi:hypothetical protein
LSSSCTAVLPDCCGSRHRQSAIEVGSELAVRYHTAVCSAVQLNVHMGSLHSVTVQPHLPTRVCPVNARSLKPWVQLMQFSVLVASLQVHTVP